jgi:hypothetical protein
MNIVSQTFSFMMIQLRTIGWLQNLNEGEKLNIETPTEFQDNFLKLPDKLFCLLFFQFSGNGKI